MSYRDGFLGLKHYSTVIMILGAQSRHPHLLWFCPVAYLLSPSGLDPPLLEHHELFLQPPPPGDACNDHRYSDVYSDRQQLNRSYRSTDFCKNKPFTVTIKATLPNLSGRTCASFKLYNHIVECLAQSVQLRLESRHSDRLWLECQPVLALRRTRSYQTSSNSA